MGRRAHWLYKRIGTMSNRLLALFKRDASKDNTSFGRARVAGEYMQVCHVSCGIMPSYNALPNPIQ